jgi:hypothetical protein
MGRGVAGAVSAWGECVGTMTLKAPMPYFGGKSRVADLIWQRFGDVPNYCEPFAGSLAVLLARPRVQGTETVNDADGLLCNLWRAVQAAPEEVAAYADWPVSECDLHSRHLWLVNEGRRRVERLKVDPEFYCAKTAGWWVWGACCWIGSGWCSGKGPHRLPEDEGELCGVAAQLPHLGDAGRGDAAASVGVSHKLPSLGDQGRGGHRAPGVNHQLPALVVGGGAGVNGHSVGIWHQRPQLGKGGNGVHNHTSDSTCEEVRAGLTAWFQALSDRLRRVRICCGDFARILGPSVTTKHGLTAVFLDPPYSHDEREAELYTEEDAEAAARAALWARENGDDPLLRICLAGYEGEHEMPASWECVRWKAAGGYGSQGEGRGRENSARECLWFSPQCVPARVLQPAMEFA